MTTQEFKPADVTLQQLGGARRLALMIGASEFYADNHGDTLMFKFKGCPKINWVRITLNEMDLYNVEFLKKGRLNKKTWDCPVKTVELIEDVYAEDLKGLFEKVTGLYLSL